MIKRIIPLPENSSFYLFGPRQTGKSTLIKDIWRSDKVWEINLLHTELYLKYLKQPYLFRKEAEYKLQKHVQNTIFIDEIQKVPLLLNEIQALIVEFPLLQVILTGSSARKLRHGNVNLLAGRLLQRYLFPFVYEELQNEFRLEEALRFGTLPAIYNKPDTQKIEILYSYTDTYLKEEIQAEGIIRNLGGFSRFLDVAAAQCGELVNFSAIARDAGIPVRTVQSYYEILEDTLVALRLDPWRKSVRKRLIFQPKYYFFDTGITNSICRRLEIFPDKMLRGRIFEQWLILETFRYISYFYPGLRIFFWRTSAGAEVDLLFEKGGKILASCEIKSSRIITNAQLSGLKSFSDEYPNVPLFIISEVDQPYHLGKVEILPWQLYLEKLKDGSLFGN